jgi:hypothetical protein
MLFLSVVMSDRRQPSQVCIDFREELFHACGKFFFFAVPEQHGVPPGVTLVFHGQLLKALITFEHTLLELPHLFAKLCNLREKRLPFFTQVLDGFSRAFDPFPEPGEGLLQRPSFRGKVRGHLAELLIHTRPAEFG